MWGGGWGGWGGAGSGIHSAVDFDRAAGAALLAPALARAAGCCRDAAPFGAATLPPTHSLAALLWPAWTPLQPPPPSLPPPRSLGGANPKYLSPSEVKEVLRRMWELNEPILAFIYPTGGCRAGQPLRATVCG